MSLELVDLLYCKVLYIHSLLDKEKHGIPIILLIQIEYSQWPIPTSIFFESPGKPEVLFPRLLKKKLHDSNKYVLFYTKFYCCFTLQMENK